MPVDQTETLIHFRDGAFSISLEQNRFVVALFLGRLLYLFLLSRYERNIVGLRQGRAEAQVNNGNGLFIFA